MNWELAGNGGTNPPTDFLGTTDGQPLVIKTNGAEVARIGTNGNIGVGAAQAGQKLTLGSGNILVQNANAGVDGNLYFGGITDAGQTGLRLFGGLVNGAIPAGFVDVRTSDRRDGLRIRVDTNNGGTERMRVTAEGNIGIGTTDPRERLNVVSRSVLTGEGILTAANPDRTGDAVAISGIVGNTGAQAGTGGPVGVLGLVDSGADGTAKAIVGFTADYSRQYAGFFFGRGWFGGSVGIGFGAQSPAFPLDVSGSAHASSFPTSSDARLKTDVEQLTHVLQKVDRIRGVSFEWNELCGSLGRSTGHKEIGVIAQEVEEVFPELVTTWGDDDFMAVDYGRLTGVLIEAIKELSQENRTLKARLDALEARV
jgi:Chaperone of endosialidase